MRYESAAAFRVALEQRLKNDAAAGGPSIQRARKRVAFERLLARLEATAPDQWLVKGGFALELRLADRARATKDVDLDWRASEAEVAEALLTATAADLDDFFDFEIDRTATAPDLGGGGLRYRVVASVAGRVFEELIVDVGFAIEPVMAPDRLLTPGALSFAGIDPVSVPAAPLEQHLAEKLHAYSRIYAGDQPSSRPKDLIDMLLIAGLTRFDGGRLRQIIEAVFTVRATHPVPNELATPTESWRAPYRALALELGLDGDLAAGLDAARLFLDPVLRRPSVTASWDPQLATWSGGRTPS
jgi:hypothetical protein